MTKKQAIAFGKSEWWDGLSDHDIVMFQLFEEKLCMDFGRFHQAVEAVLGRPVWTHEFAGWADLQKEFLGDKPAPTWQEVVNLIPEDKRVVIQAPPHDQEAGC